MDEIVLDALKVSPFAAAAGWVAIHFIKEYTKAMADRLTDAKENAKASIESASKMADALHASSIATEKQTEVMKTLAERMSSIEKRIGGNV